MNLQEIAGSQPTNRALQLKLQQQSKKVSQLETENKWLRDQLKKAREGGTWDNRRKHRK